MCRRFRRSATAAGALWDGSRCGERSEVSGLSRISRVRRNSPSQRRRRRIRRGPVHCRRDARKGCCGCAACRGRPKGPILGPSGRVLSSATYDHYRSHRALIRLPTAVGLLVLHHQRFFARLASRNEDGLNDRTGSARGVPTHGAAEGTAGGAGGFLARRLAVRRTAGLQQDCGSLLGRSLRQLCRRDPRVARSDDEGFSASARRAYVLPVPGAPVQSRRRPPCAGLGMALVVLGALYLPR